MTSPLRELSENTRADLLHAFEANRLQVPYTSIAVAPYVGATAAAGVAAELERLSGLGMTSAHIRELLAVLVGEEAIAEPKLVWSGPEEPGAATRDTAVVLRELFGDAKQTILVAGFAVYQGRSVFQVLADRMDADPGLRVTMYLNINRQRGDTTLASGLVREFGERFRRMQWPGKRLPELYYDMRAVVPHQPAMKRAALHAKCVVIDGYRSLITSANFTEAAQDRNIEVGVVLNSRTLASGIEEQFRRLIVRGILAPLRL